MRYKQVFPEMNICLSKNKSYRVIFHFELTNIVKLDALLWKNSLTYLSLSLGRNGHGD